MNNIFTALIATLKVKLSGPLRRLSLLFSATYWNTIILSKLRKYFFKLFDVRPRDKKDYYPLFRWLVSKRLAFAIVVILGIACGYYVMSATPFKAWITGGGDGIPTYSYSSIPLRFTTGKVRILASNRSVGYVGDVSKGSCNGSGQLYRRDGTKLYEGQFADSKFSGSGVLYYPDGAKEYNGGFSENLFHGKGDFYRSSATLEYSGDYVDGKRTGMGKLFDTGENLYFSGAFLDDRVVYPQFLGKPTTEIAGMYTGDGKTYSTTDEYCVQMPEIGAVYAVTDGTNSLNAEWIVDNISVLGDSFILEGKEAKTIDELTQLLGEPDYQGVTNATLSEVVALNQLNEQDNKMFGEVPMETTATFDTVFDVQSYDRTFEVYIYSYKVNGLLYSFYTDGPGNQNFAMYSIESI